MAKGDKFYFENFTAGTALSKKAALYLVECLENYDPENIEQMMKSMHEIEHQADVKKHEMNAALAKYYDEFVQKYYPDRISNVVITRDELMESCEI